MIEKNQVMIAYWNVHSCLFFTVSILSLVSCATLPPTPEPIAIQPTVMNDHSLDTPVALNVAAIERATNALNNANDVSINMITTSSWGNGLTQCRIQGSVRYCEVDNFGNLQIGDLTYHFLHISDRTWTRANEDDSWKLFTGQFLEGYAGLTDPTLISSIDGVREESDTAKQIDVAFDAIRLLDHLMPPAALEESMIVMDSLQATGQLTIDSANGRLVREEATITSDADSDFRVAYVIAYDYGASDDPITLPNEEYLFELANQLVLTVQRKQYEQSYGLWATITRDELSLEQITTALDSATMQQEFSTIESIELLGSAPFTATTEVASQSIDAIDVAIIDDLPGERYIRLIGVLEEDGWKIGRFDFLHADQSQ